MFEVQLLQEGLQRDCISISASLSAQAGRGKLCTWYFFPLCYMVPFNSCVSFTGQDKCSPCPAGFHCSKGLRRRCPPGFYCPEETGISFYPCPPGTYNPSYGLSQAERCQECPAGEEMTEYSDGPCRAVSKGVTSAYLFS